MFRLPRTKTLPPSQPHAGDDPLSRGWTARFWVLLAAALLVVAAAGAPGCTLDSMGLAPAGTSTGSGTGSGTGQACTEEAQCPGPTNDCQRPNCVGGECGTYLVPMGTTCTMDGGRYCNGLGACVECAEDGHCAGATEICDTSAWQCIPTTCTDGSQNGGESDVDCGGPCAGCADGQHCAADDDCLSGYCNYGICSPCTLDEQCTDGYCDEASGVCQDAKDDGEACDDPSHCASGFCPPQDGVCCDAACDGTCVGCLTSTTGGTDGECAPVSADTDPHDECAPQTQDTCGTTGECNGNASSPGCAFFPDGTACSGQSCTNGTVYPPDLCDGAGSCVDTGSQSCNGFDCNGASCRTVCSAHWQCLDAYWCDTDQACKPDKGLGETCSAAQECTSGYCVDGVCCDNACGGSCMTCAGSSPGTCEGFACDCSAQYSSYVNHYDQCQQTANECEFYGDGGFQCSTVCRNAGGECLNAWDNDSGNCGRSANPVGCNATLNSQICLCSRGCGSGPRCPTGQSCSSGTCS